MILLHHGRMSYCRFDLILLDRGHPLCFLSGNGEWRTENMVNSFSSSAFSALRSLYPVLRRVTSALLLFFVLLPSALSAHNPIRIVGSTAVYPFVTMVAERVGKKTSFKTPIVEAMSTGGGIK